MVTPEDLTDSGMSVDISAVRRDDALIDAISGDRPIEAESTEVRTLATLLAGWRAEILSGPEPVVPDLDQVVAAVHRELDARCAPTTPAIDTVIERVREYAQMHRVRAEHYNARAMAQVGRIHAEVATDLERIIDAQPTPNDRSPAE